MPRTPAQERAAGYRSGLEDATAEMLRTRCTIPWAYEPGRISYTVPSRSAHYTPDFVFANGVVVETKGRWLTEDRKKIKLIREQYPGLALRMVFTRSKTTISKTSKTTYAAVCERLGIPFADKTIPPSWWEEPPDETSLFTLRAMGIVL